MKKKLTRWLTLWVVEMWIHTTDRWEPTTGAALTKAEAQVVKQDWKNMNPDDQFRVCPYVRVIV